VACVELYGCSVTASGIDSFMGMARSPSIGPTSVDPPLCSIALRFGAMYCASSLYSFARISMGVLMSIAILAMHSIGSQPIAVNRLATASVPLFGVPFTRRLSCYPAPCARPQENRTHLAHRTEARDNNHHPSWVAGIHLHLLLGAAEARCGYAHLGRHAGLQRRQAGPGHALEHVEVYSLEMPREHIAFRMLATEIGIPAREIRAGNIGGDRGR